METSANDICRLIPEILFKQGVKDFVVSPGSRNAPLLLSAAAIDGVKIKQIVDERSAAFYALGLSSISECPVCLICTSGSALLNYAPAVAEAYYRGIPLIVVSADRPKAWIDCDDSQTIRQSNALQNFVKASYDISDASSQECLWHANRIINDAFITAISSRKGPVHINCSIDIPLSEMINYSMDNMLSHRTITNLTPSDEFKVGEVRRLSESLKSPHKVMIICGFMAPNKRLNQALAKIARKDNVVVLTESIANLHNQFFVNSIGLTIATIPQSELDEFLPDVVISVGGSIVSHHLKEFIRKNPPPEHWHVGVTHSTIDCYRALTCRIMTDPGLFFQQMASAMQPHNAPSEYSRRWRTTYIKAQSLLTSFTAKAAWSDLKAISDVLPMIPRRWNVQYSNGTSIRYAQLFGNKQYHRCDCNRGVSGIDGCTSTAIGACEAYGAGCTLLISGDMSAIYDIGALSIRNIPSRFKMIVLNNGGGEIFRYIKATRSMPVAEGLLSNAPEFPGEDLSHAFGFRYFHASSSEELRSLFVDFAGESQQPSLLIINTSAGHSANTLTQLFKFIRSHQ